MDRALRDRIERWNGSHLVGISMLADGPDQLFAQAILDHGGRLKVIVPASEYRAALPSEAWPAYDRLLARAGSVVTLPYTTSTEEAHLAGGQAVAARADLLLAVWDGQPARGVGGTADVVAHARTLGVPVEVVWPIGATRD